MRLQDDCLNFTQKMQKMHYLVLQIATPNSSYIYKSGFFFEKNDFEIVIFDMKLANHIFHMILCNI